MRLGRLGPIGAEVPVVWQGDDGVRPARGQPRTSTRRSGRPTDRPRSADGWRRATSRVLDGADGMRVGAPFARPGAVICVGPQLRGPRGGVRSGAARAAGHLPQDAQHRRRPERRRANPAPQHQDRLGGRARASSSAGRRATWRRRRRASAAWPGSCSPTTCRSGPSSWRSPAASGARASAVPGSRRPARGWSPPTRSTTVRWPCGRGSTASRARTRPRRTWSSASSTSSGTSASTSPSSPVTSCSPVPRRASASPGGSPTCSRRRRVRAGDPGAGPAAPDVRLSPSSDPAPTVGGAGRRSP